MHYPREYTESFFEFILCYGRERPYLVRGILQNILSYLVNENLSARQIQLLRETPDISLHYAAILLHAFDATDITLVGECSSGFPVKGGSSIPFLIKQGTHFRAPDWVANQLSIDWPQPTFPYLVGHPKCSGPQQLFFKTGSCCANPNIEVLDTHPDGADHFSMMKIENIPHFESTGKLKLTIFLAEQGSTGSYDGYRNNYEPKSSECVIAMQVFFFDRLISYIQEAYGVQMKERKEDVEQLRSNFDRDIRLKKIKDGVYRCLDVENWYKTPKYLKVFGYF